MLPALCGVCHVVLLLPGASGPHARVHRQSGTWALGHQVGAADEGLPPCAGEPGGAPFVHTLLTITALLLLLFCFATTCSCWVASLT